ncbi:hypothetical protein MmiAt1_10730 [Methanimicrococcus sp. At1]|uniref:Uncharacterized protein n=1 Tax=Methanimicrococcus hacksteinii TaxID=3028293 RepID=A0ABU3VQB4_9EURY|nr:hypothetical protein [Methanimicrococcus sp. At1]MDV0445490.1 hypothetical protein [Methanimicrococcus sp. At1]
MNWRKELENRYGIEHYPEEFEKMRNGIMEIFKERNPTIQYSDEGITINEQIDEELTKEFEFALQIILEDVYGFY